jgi:putative sterol carrier protein
MTEDDKNTTLNKGREEVELDTQVSAQNTSEDDEFLGKPVELEDEIFSERGEALEQDDLALSDEDSEGEDIEVSATKEGKTFSQFESLLLSSIPKNASNFDPKLRGHLSRPVTLRLAKEGRYIFDWSSEVLSVKKLEALETETHSACVIDVDIDSFNKILRGLLNPQLAMLSGKVKIKGDSSSAIYFFTLFYGVKRCLA